MDAPHGFVSIGQLDYAVLREAPRPMSIAGIKKLVADGLSPSASAARAIFHGQGQGAVRIEAPRSMQPFHLHLGFGDQYGSARLIGDLDRYPLVAELGGVVSEDARRSRGGLALHLLHALALYALLIFPDVVSVANVEKAFRHKRMNREPVFSFRIGQALGVLCDPASRLSADPPRRQETGACRYRSRLQREP